MSLINASDSKGPYWKKKGRCYPRYHYPAYSKALNAAAKARAKKSTKISGGSRRTPQFKTLTDSHWIR